ncbi:hypothetical protein N4T77_15450 [Clostridium sp. CX1]|uniref:YvlB/LiaX N-terminal domain-containing protein n=1 Tax=Clostridium tanneri TaxID=3037988 RepID=A0ABU4JV86_9CLOT|nr:MULTISPECIES: hypothetical protein [unclassified Clostridium]MCT8977988.1 hypothetical protein [Clostridium sp. CX1]MDW8802057.1 hypothetical protein [Clostridium sp. A1-XYC3]
MKEEVKRILKMFEEGKIDLDKAAELIEALNKSADVKQLPVTGNLDKMLKVIVLSATKDTVNVNVPVKFLKAIGNAVNNIKIPGVSDQDGIDIKMIMEAIDSGLEGKIVDVKSSNGDIVEVSIE